MKLKNVIVFILIAIISFTPIIAEGASIITNDEFSRGDIVPYGKDIPTQIYDLSTGNYKFDFISTNDTTMYTSYRFTGHNGRIALNFTENGGGSGKYEVAVCKLNSSGFLTVLTTNEFNRGTTYYWPVPSSKIGSSEVVFLRFRPLGNGTLSGNGIVSAY